MRKKQKSGEMKGRDWLFIAILIFGVDCLTRDGIVFGGGAFLLVCTAVALITVKANERRKYVRTK